MVSGTQEDPQRAPIEGVVLTEAEVEAFAAESLASNLKKEGSEEGVSEEAKASFQEMWQREKESALRKEAERKRSEGNEREAFEGRGQEAS